MSLAIQKKAQHIPCGWRSTLRKADTVDKAGTDRYGHLRTLGLWRSVGHVPGSLESTWLTGGAGVAHCAEPILRAEKQDL